MSAARDVEPAAHLRAPTEATADRTAPEPGRIPPSLAPRLSARLGFDVGSVRLHADDDAADRNARAGSVAFSRGQDIFLSRDVRDPLSARGEAVLAHELAHVAQHLAGATDPEAGLEAQAQEVERGGSLGRLRPGAPRAPVHRYLRGGLLTMTIEPRADGSATFTAELDGGGSAAASGTVQDLAPGTYLGRVDGQAITLSDAEGNPLPHREFFAIPDNPGNRRFLVGVGLTTGQVTITVSVAAPAREPDGNGDGGDDAGPGPDPDADLRRRLDDLPDRIRNALFTGERSSAPSTRQELETLLRIAEKLEGLTDAELAEYAARTTSSTSDLAEYESSIDAWLVLLEERHATVTESEEATAALIGLDEAYEMYSRWMLGPTTHATSRDAAQWEGIPTAELPERSEYTMVDLYFRIRRAVDPHGFANVRAFENAILRFLAAFRERAVAEAMESLDRREHLLQEQHERYAGEAAADLSTALEPARASAAAAEEYRRGANAQFGGSWDPDDILAYHAAGAEYRRQRAEAGAQVTSLSADYPVLAEQGFGVDELIATNGEAEVRQLMRSYTSDQIEKTRDTRARILDDHETIFRLDLLVDRVKGQQGIEAGSLWARLISDHQAPDIDDEALHVMLAVIAIALIPATAGGSVAALAVTAGISTYEAVTAYQEYAERNDAYGAQLLSEEPELAWVVLAVIAAGLDVAAVGAAIRPIRGALRAFQWTKNLEQLTEELAEVEPRLRATILARAELEARSAGGWQRIVDSIVPPGVARASIGVDLLAERIGALVYSIQLNVRRGINTFMRWRLSQEAADLVGAIDNLTPAQVRQLRTLYNQASANLQRVATEGRALGLSSEQVGDVLQAWAQSGGTVDDVLEGMRSAARAAGDVVVDLRAAGASAAAVRRSGGTLSLNQMVGRINPVTRTLEWTPVSSAIARAGDETLLRPASAYGLEGYIRYHIRGPGLGREGYPIFLAPERANQFANNHIEGFMRTARDAGSTVRFQPTYTTFGGQELRGFLEALLRGGDTTVLSRFALDYARVERFLKSIVYDIEIIDAAGVRRLYRARIDIPVPGSGGSVVGTAPVLVP